MKKISSDDAKAKNDYLNYNKYARAVSKIILDAKAPYTIGITGEWGYGKTTLMNFISYYLDKNKYDKDKENGTFDYSDSIESFHSTKFIGEKNETKFFSIFLNTWPFINSKDIGNSIFEQIMMELIKIIKENSGAFEDNGKFLLRAMSGFLKTVKINGKINLLGNEIGYEIDPSKFQMDDLFDEDINYSNFRSELKLILAKITEKKGNIILFIDDLDRLYPKQALQVILFIKNFLNFEKCFFIIGSDKKIIAEGLEELYGKFHRNNELDDSYKEYIKGLKDNFFEKIFQLDFKLPGINANEIDFYLNQEFGLDKILFTKAYYNNLKSFLTKINPSLNPRKTKRCFSMYNLIKNLVDEDDKLTGREFEHMLMLEIALIYEFSLDDYNFLRKESLYKDDKLATLDQKVSEENNANKDSNGKKIYEDTFLFKNIQADFVKIIFNIFGTSNFEGIDFLLLELVKLLNDYNTIDLKDKKLEGKYIGDINNIINNSELYALDDNINRIIMEFNKIENYGDTFITSITNFISKIPKDRSIDLKILKEKFNLK